MPTNEKFLEIPSRIRNVASAALMQANHQAVYSDKEDDIDQIAVLNAATAGELFLKAIIAEEHPFLIFQNLNNIKKSKLKKEKSKLNKEKSNLENEVFDGVIEHGRTYNFSELPDLYWIATEEEIPDRDNFKEFLKIRNSIQHFCAPEDTPFQKFTFEFIYKNIDPLIHKHFELCAIDFCGDFPYENEDLDALTDLVISLISREIVFSIPKEFHIAREIFDSELSKTSKDYRKKLSQRNFSSFKISLS